MKRRQEVLVTVLTAATLAFFASDCPKGRADEAVRRAMDSPNVLVVLTDDQGYGDVQSHGNSFVQTPYQDQIAAQGARFDRFFVSPVCAPTRASLLTGRWHLRTGVHGVTRGNETMRAGEVTMAEVFRTAGYATAAIGKWHNGAHYPEHPRGQGFDRFFGFCGGHFNNYFDSRLEDDDRVVPFDGFIIDRLTDRALQFMREQRNQPWFCYVALNTPHSPWQVPNAYWQRYADRADLPDDKARCAYAMVENIDDNLGRMLSEIERLQLDEQTIIVFLTDNGANSDRYNSGMRGRKGSLHEGGSRVPCFVRWPGVIPKDHVVKPIAAHIDLLPTLCDLANVPVPASVSTDGVSLVPLLTRQSSDWPQRTLFAQWGDDRRIQRPDRHRGAARTDRWRAVCQKGSWQLFDMQKDPGETTDVAKQYPEVAADLADQYRRWFDDVTRDGFEPIPIQIGRAGKDNVLLPGHEARLFPAQGEGIRYQGRAGWANDWVTGWTGQDAYAAWNLQVESAGRYQVTVHYAATPTQVGNVLRIQAGQQHVDAAVLDAHPITPLPSPDRIARGEVYESRWAKLHAGALNLQPGPIQLAVRAVRKNADELVSIKAIQLRKLPAEAEQASQ